MPIFDQGYQHWHGRLSGQAGRWLAITRNGVLVQLKNRWVRWIVIAGLGPYGYIVAMQAALQGAGQLPASLPAAIRVGPK